MIKYIEASAKEVGIVTVFLNSNDRIESQLNRVNRDEQNPIMLISWDIDTSLNFDSNGFLENPAANIVALLVQKPETTSDDEATNTTDEMSALFETFLQNLYNRLSPLTRVGVPAITGATYKRVPKHGAGKHSGVLARWTQRNPINLICTSNG